MSVMSNQMNILYQGINIHNLSKLMKLLLFVLLQNYLCWTNTVYLLVIILHFYELQFIKIHFLPYIPTIMELQITD